MKRLIILLPLSPAFSVQASEAVSTRVTTDCAASGGLNFICGMDKPEDLKPLPGTRWLITSGFSPGSGLKLVDMRRKRMSVWFRADAAQINRDQARYPDCATPPDRAMFNARGLSLRLTGKASATLHVVNHGGREAIEVFDIALGKREPQLTWRGCLHLPEGHVGNAVATYSDGTVLVSILTRPGTSITDFERGKATGGIMQRGPGERAFSLIPGSELPGNNGLETARDDRGFYTIAFGLRAVALFERGRAGPRAIIKAPGFMPDNIAWQDGRLIAAGMVADEPACGGTRQIVNGVADGMKCPRGYRVAAFDPATQRWAPLAQGSRNPAFNGVSSAAITGDILWLGSYQADRLAWRRMKRGR
jgi:hypothetical protein